jgi:hypothetical protein
MKPKALKTTLAASLGLLFCNTVATSHASLVLTFTDSTAVAAKPGACSGIAWTAGAEYRMCDASGVSLGGGVPLQRDAILGGETYSFNDASLMTGVTGTPGNLGSADFPGSAAPAANTTSAWQQSAIVFGQPFNFLAPVSGSLAGAAYGNATYIGGVPTAGTNTPFILAPVLEMQWAGGFWFPLGQSFTQVNGIDTGPGVQFIADISNVVTVGNSTAFDFHLFANECVDYSGSPAGCTLGGGTEDPGITGAFDAWTAEWHMQGSGVYTAPVPVPAAVWLFGSGLLGLLGAAHRRKAVSRHTTKVTA